MSRKVPGFDEAFYLKAYPDVAAAVANGVVGSGAEHYGKFGRMEGRMMNDGVRSPPLRRTALKSSRATRRDKTLLDLDLSMLRGMEIGALASPMVRPAEGDIFYVDYTETPNLKQHYLHDPAVDVDRLVDVDAVWGLHTLQECLGADRRMDYVVASHVIEHVPDLVTWLGEIHSILSTDGTLRLAIPDRRFTFDYLRAPSEIWDVLDSHLRRARAPQPRQIIEHFSLMREVDCVAAWKGPLDKDKLTGGSLAQGLALAKDTLETGNYHDCHCWVFTPGSFARLCAELAGLDLLDFECDYYFDTAPNELEFFVSMKPSADRSKIIESWRAMQRALASS